MDQEQERDLVVFADEEGNELTLEVLDYFFYNGQEYAVLSEAHECDCDDCEECEDGEELYIMKVVAVGEDQEEFVPVEESLMDTLVDIVQTRFAEMDEDDDEDDEDDEEDMDDEDADDEEDEDDEDEEKK